MPSGPPEVGGAWAPGSVPRVEQPYAIPTGYGEDRIVLLVKDPWWIYAYWEVRPETERAVRHQLLPREIPGLQSILRVYDVTGIDFPTQPAHRTFDISLSGLATNWYIQTNAPDREFLVELGLLTGQGRFLRLVRSNRVRTPRFGPSEVIDEQWMTTDELYWKLFGAASIGFGASQAGWAKLVPQQLFSGGWSSGSLFSPSRPAAIRGFWCRVNTDLVVHGATEPRATVLVQGQPVAVRKDGTFSLRVALPDGMQTITVEVTSPDGRHTKTVTPIVTLAWTGALGDVPAKIVPTPRPATPEVRQGGPGTPGSLA